MGIYYNHCNLYLFFKTFDLNFSLKRFEFLEKFYKFLFDFFFENLVQEMIFWKILDDF